MANNEGNLMNGISRRDFMHGAGAGLAGVMLAGRGLAKTASPRPNVLLIEVDQMRFPRWFPRAAGLSAFEKLESQGISFTNHFVCAVPCSPSRACLFTGLHIDQHGVESNVNIGGHDSMDPRITTLAHIFKAAGYRTPYFGKWHLTRSEDYNQSGLTPYGFEEWKGPDRDGTPYDGLRHDKGFADQAVQWLWRHGKNAPWFLTCSMINPHDICYYRRADLPDIIISDVFSELPDNWNDDLRAKPRIQAIYRHGYGKLNKTLPEEPKKVWLHYLDFYYYLTRRIDHQLARLMATLEHLGLARNTIVLFTADHGDMCGSHKLQAKGPFVYQENNNVPLVIRWPGQIPAGVKSDALCQNVDVLPTLVQLAGVTAAKDYLPGKSLSRIATGEDAKAVNDHVLMNFGMKIGRGRMGRMAARLCIDATGVPMLIRAIYDGRYKYARYFDEGLQDEYELYDLQEDPGELHNLTGDQGYKAVEREMADRLSDAQSKEMAPLFKDIFPWK